MTIKNTTISFVVVLVLLSLEINGPNIGLPAFITGKRVGLIALTYILLKQPHIRLNTPIQITFIITTLCFVMFWIYLSCIVTGSVSFTEWIQRILIWSLITYGVYAFNRLLPFILIYEKQLFINSLIYMGFFLNITTILWLIFDFGFSVFMSPTTLRLALNDNIYIGMNRFLNGMFFGNAMTIAAFLGIVKTNKHVFIVAVLAFISFCSLCFFAASRQTLGALVLYMIVLFIVNVIVKPYKRKNQGYNYRTSDKTIYIGITFFVVSIISLLAIPQMKDNITEMIIKKTELQFYTESQGRITVLKDAWTTANNYPLFGVGDFLHHEGNSLKIWAHNGYAQLLVESGFPPIIAFIGLFIYCLTWAFKMRYKSRSNVDIWQVSFSYLFVYIFWSIFFNDILKEYMLFYLLTILVLSITISEDKQRYLRNL